MSNELYAMSWLALTLDVIWSFETTSNVAEAT